MKAKDLLLKNNTPSILIYGPAGTGKTALVSQATNSYMLDFDGGMRTAALLNDKFTSLRQNCEFDTYVDENPQKPTAWLAASNKINNIIAESAAGTLKYDTVIVDSLTGLVKCMQLQIMMEETNDAFRKPQIQHWGTMVNTMEKTLTLLRAIKCVLLVTAHETDFEVDKVVCLRPLSVTERHSKNKLAWLFDEVFHSSIRPAGMNKSKYILSGHSTSSIMARTRSGMNEAMDITECGLQGILDKIGYKK